MESITNTEDMLCNVLILALIVNDSLKSRVWENRKHGSVGVTIALKLNSILIWSKCYGFYLSLWDVSSGTLIKSINFPDNSVIISRTLCTASFSPDGKYIVHGLMSNGHTHEIYIWDISSDDFVFSLYEKMEPPSKCLGFPVSFSPDGKYLITPGQNNIAKLWVTDELIPSIKEQVKDTPIAYNEESMGIFELDKGNKHIKQDFKQIEEVKREENLLEKKVVDVKNIKMQQLSLDYTQGEYRPEKYQDIENNSIIDETKIVKRIHDIMMSLFQENGNDIYSKVQSNPDEASVYYSSIEKKYRELYSEEYSNLEHKLRVKTIYQGIAIGCDTEGDSLKNIVGMVKNGLEVTQIEKYYFHDKKVRQEEVYALENLIESISNWLSHLDKIKHVELNEQKVLLLQNLKQEINKTKLFCNEGFDTQDILKKTNFLTENNLTYISQHLDDTASDILGHLDIDYSDMLI